MRSAAWARSRRRWPAPAPRAASTFARTAAVSEILVEKGRAVGVVTDKGERIAARAVVSNLHPKLTFEKLLDPAVLPADFRARIGSYRSGSGSFRMNLALSRAAELYGASGPRSCGASRRGHRDRAEPRLYGARLSRRPAHRLVGRADHRNADPLDPRRFARAHRAATSPRCSASMSRRRCRTGAHGTMSAKRSRI